MRKILIIGILIVCASLSLVAQENPVNNINENIIIELKELPVDLYARINERQNDKGESLAVIKVSFPTLQNITFENNMGEVLEDKGEYIVYVNPGTTSLSIFSNNQKVAVLDLSELEIKPKTTYQAILTMNQTRQQIGVQVEPYDAIVEIVEVDEAKNGKKHIVELDAEGNGIFSYIPGKKYTYSISKKYYKPATGEFMGKEDEAEMEAIAYILEPKTANVTINTNTGDSQLTIYVDDISYGSVPNGGTLALPVGPQIITVQAINKRQKKNYEDWTYEEFIGEEGQVIEITNMIERKNDVGLTLRDRWGVYAGAGIAFGQRINDEKMTGYPIRIGFEYDHFFTRNFSVRPEIEAFIYAGKDFRRENSEGKKGTPFAFDLAVPFNLNVPLSRFNIHFFTLGVGPLIGVLALDSPYKTDATSLFMYGGRVEARFYFNKFTFGASLDYQGFGKDKDKVKFTDKGIWVPTVVIGYLFK